MRTLFINISATLCLLIFFMPACKQNESDYLVAKWKSVHLSNTKMDQQIAEMRAYIDTVGNQDAGLRSQIDIDSLKTMLKNQLNDAIEEQRIALENTTMEFKPNGVVYTTSVQGVDSAMYRIEENNIIVDEAKLKGYGETMKFELMTLTKDSLRLKLIDYGDTSIVSMIPVK